MLAVTFVSRSNLSAESWRPVWPLTPMKEKRPARGGVRVALSFGPFSSTTPALWKRWKRGADAKEAQRWWRRQSSRWRALKGVAGEHWKAYKFYNIGDVYKKNVTIKKPGSARRLNDFNPTSQPAEWKVKITCDVTNQRLTLTLAPPAPALFLNLKKTLRGT